MGSDEHGPEAMAAWVPENIDSERPSSARVYDYYLGGAHNFAADRRLAEQMIAAYPEAPLLAQVNRAFLRRAVEFMVGAGVRQFLDIGSGVPTVGHVHEIAQRLAPESRVVFVDIDPVAVAHSRLILADNDRTVVIHADVRRPEDILAAPELELLDLGQPVGVLAVALFHFIPETDDPAGILSRLTAPLASGSYLAISHLADRTAQDATAGKELYSRAGIELTSRSREQVAALFGDFEVVDPGVVWVPLWWPESSADLLCDDPERSAGYGAVGHKP